MVDLLRVEPLDAPTWFEEMRKLGSYLQTARTADGVERSLRKAYYLSVLAPDPFWRVFGSSWLCDELAFESHLETEALELSARQLLNPALDLTILTLDERFHMTVRIAGLTFRGRSASEDFATAVLGAWLECIQAVEDNVILATQLLTDRDRRRFQSEPHLP